jgi:hypothetical protein
VIAREGAGFSENFDIKPGSLPGLFSSVRRCSFCDRANFQVMYGTIGAAERGEAASGGRMRAAIVCTISPSADG